MSSPIAGELVTESLGYDGGRQVTVYVPPVAPEAVVFAGDGQNATRWAVALRGAGADVVMAERPGPHGGAFWAEEFPLMVAWAFGR
jgi:hypothetical protein